MFSDGTTASGPSVTRTCDQPGVFSELLKVTDKAGNIDYDFAEVHVLDPKQPDLYVPRIHAAYWPTLDNRAFDLRRVANSLANVFGHFGKCDSPLQRQIYILAAPQIPDIR
jgi:hypothetical protein